MFNLYIKYFDYNLVPIFLIYLLIIQIFILKLVKILINAMMKYMEKYVVYVWKGLNKVLFTMVGTLLLKISNHTKNATNLVIKNQSLK